MKSPYREDKTPEPKKVRFKNSLKEMNSTELHLALKIIETAARAYIVKATESFLKNFNKKDRFQLVVKRGIINTMPPKYNERFIKRVNKLCNMAESVGYTANFSKWRTSEEYGWFFVRQAEL